MAAAVRKCGRKKGTPNKATQLGRETIAKFLDAYSSTGLMHEDFMKLKPRERLIIVEKLLQYHMPKYQAITYDVAITETKLSIEQKLKQLCGE